MTGLPEGSPRPRLAVVVVPESVDPLGLRSALSELCELVWVLCDASEAGDELVRLLRRLGEVVDLRGVKRDELERRVRAAAISGVVGFADEALVTVSEIGTRLGLRCNPPEVTRRLTDKLEQRRALLAAGLPVPGFRALGREVSIPDLPSLLRGLTFPVVVKPLHGTGSLDVSRADSPEEVEAVLHAYRSGPRHDDLLVEEMIPGMAVPPGIGDYLSVESFVEDGRPVSLGATARFALSSPFREVGSFVPAPFAAEVLESAVEMTESALVGLGVRWGAAHTELKLSPEGPRIIEVNGRLGGIGVPEIWSPEIGRPLAEVAARNLLAEQPPLSETCGDLESVPMDRPGFTYSLGLLPPLDAVAVGSIGDLARLRELPGVGDVVLNRSVGDRVDWREGYQSRVVVVRGHAENLERLGALPALVEEVAGVGYLRGTVRAQ